MEVDGEVAGERHEYYGGHEVLSVPRACAYSEEVEERNLAQVKNCHVCVI